MKWPTISIPDTTPGDWLVGCEGCIEGGVVINAETGQGVIEGIAEILPRSDKRDIIGNAFLMAGAPKLYKAVETAIWELANTKAGQIEVNAAGVTLIDFLKEAIKAASPPACAFDTEDDECSSY